jgi:hypothetical protein
MKPRLRAISYVQDQPPEGWSHTTNRPFSDAFNFWTIWELHLESSSEVLWSLNVVSTKWIEESGRPFTERAAVVLPEYDEAQFDRFIRETLEACAADTWRGVWTNLAARLELDESVSLDWVLSRTAAKGGVLDI